MIYTHDQSYVLHKGFEDSLIEREHNSDLMSRGGSFWIALPRAGACVL